MKRIIAPACISLAFLAITGCSAKEPDAATTPAAPLRVLGTVDLVLPNFVWSSDNDTCWGTRDFSDIQPGGQVVVSDSSGTTIAVGALISGIPEIEPDRSRATLCSVTFVVDRVPAGKGFYGVEITSHGRLQYSEADVVKPLKFNFSG